MGSMATADSQMSRAFSTAELVGWTGSVLLRGIGAGLADNRLRARTVSLCAGVALASHAAVGLALTVWGLRDTGTIVRPTDAISLELMASDVVEQSAQPEARAAPTSAAAVAPVEGSADERATAAASAEPEKKADEPIAPPAAPEAETPGQEAEAPPLPVAPEPSEVPPMALHVPVPEPAAPAQQEAKPVENPRPKRDERVRRRVEKPVKTADEIKTEQHRKQGGARSRGQAESRSAPARVSASAGDVSGYTARVRARVAANRPSGGGMRGTAFISFGISKSGGLTYARVARSSGNARLDQAALAAVRRSAPFPPPPAGQIRLSMPFYFR